MTSNEQQSLYRERAHLVAFLSAIYPSAMAYSDPLEPDWVVVYVETPTGQMSWHISREDMDLFGHVPMAHPGSPLTQWDGHSSGEKYRRLAELTARAHEVRHDYRNAPVMGVDQEAK